MTEIVTGEAVALELPAAGFPARMAALIIDVAVQQVVLVVFTIASVALAAGNADYTAAYTVAGAVLVIIGYPAAFETLSRGKTLGKLALGLRVVGDDGSPERFRQALVRALAAVFEIWSLAPVALITSLVSARGRRVGDALAGTYVITERVPRRAALAPQFAAVPPPLAGWARSLQVTALSGQAAEAAASYLRRFGELSPQTRDSLGATLAAAVAAQVSPPPPPGTPPAAYLSAVLAVRRQQDLTGARALPPPQAAGWPAPALNPAMQGPAQQAPAAQAPAPAVAPLPAWYPAGGPAPVPAGQFGPPPAAPPPPPPPPAPAPAAQDALVPPG